MSFAKKLGLFSLSFLLSYAIFLIVWLQIKTLYQILISTFAFQVNSFLLKLKLLDIGVANSDIAVVLTNKYIRYDIFGQNGDMVFDLLLYIDPITANTPMTIALLISIIFSFKNENRDKNLIFLGMLLLFFLHLSTMIFLAFSSINAFAATNSSLMQYLQIDFNNELISYINTLFVKYASRFEPFLISIFAWFTLQNRAISRRNEIIRSYN